MGCGSSSAAPPDEEHDVHERRPLLKETQARGGPGPHGRQPAPYDVGRDRGPADRGRMPPLDLNRAQRAQHGDDSDQEGSGDESGMRSGGRARPPKKTRKTASRASSPRNRDGANGMTTEQMALTIALDVISKEKQNNKNGTHDDEEMRRASALAAAMVAWVEAQLAQGNEVGRRPKNNFCFKCGAALHSAATFCADCGVRTPREGETESWREREARLKREREEKEKKDEEERRTRAVTAFSGVGSNSSPALLGGKKEDKPRPAKLKDMRGLSLLGETEEVFRKRQNLERQESQQRLFGLDADLKDKEQQKLSQEDYKKMVIEAMHWIEQILGDQGVGSFPDNLKSGRVLCNLINKYWPNMIPVVNDRPITLLERENIRFYLEACEKVGVRKQDLFIISDLYEEKYLTAVILNIYALAAIIQRQSTFHGPKLVNYA